MNIFKVQTILKACFLKACYKARLVCNKSINFFVTFHSCTTTPNEIPTPQHSHFECGVIVQCVHISVGWLHYKQQSLNKNIWNT